MERRVHTLDAFTFWQRAAKERSRIQTQIIGILKEQEAGHAAADVRRNHGFQLSMTPQPR